VKRGQITVFIIVGLLLVLAVGSIIYLNARQVQEATIPQLQQVATEAQPVQDYITECIERIGQEGLRQIGDHGGYLSFRDVPNSAPNPANPTEGDILLFAPDSEYGIPYWWYLKSPNTCDGDCAFSSKQPRLHKRQGSPSIEAALELYVKQNLDTCLKDFAPLSEQGMAVTADERRDARVFITDSDVVISLEQTFRADTPAGRHTLDTFVANLPVRLKDIYDLATNITILESENAFLGKHSRELIAAFSGTAPDKLPPVGSMEMELGPGTVWVKLAVQERIQQLLQSYVPVLQVFGTRNYRPIETPANIQNPGVIENALNRNALIPQLKAFPQLEARFIYLDSWKPYFDLNCDGQICRPESMLNTFGPVFGLQRYSFAYDLSYPVMVELSEPGAFNGEGFTFRFALEGNIRNNEPLTTDWESPDVPLLEAQTTLLCDESQRTSGVFNITLFNTVTRSPVDGALTFECGAESCSVGETREGKLSTRLPRCLGGRLSAAQTDYLADVVVVETATDADQAIDLAMNPIIEVNVTARKYQLRKDPLTESWNLAPEALFFSEYDQAIISATREAQDGQNPFSAFASVCGSPLYKGGEYSRDVRITPGNYTVSVSTLHHGNITIPVDRRCYKYKKGPFREKKECFNIPSEPIHFGNSTRNACVSEKPFPSGNVQFTWEVTPEMLRNARTITFPTITLGAEVPGTRLVIEDLSQLNKAQAYADSEPSLIRPEVRQ